MKEISINRETKIGIFATICIAAMIWGINFLKGKNIFSPNNIYYAWYPSVDGLEVTNNVLVNGFKVGLVNNIHFEYDNPDSKKFLVTLLIGKKYGVPKNSVAKLVSADLLGGMAIKLELSKESTYHEQGDTLTSTIERGLMDQLSTRISPLMQKTELLVENLNQTADAFNKIFNQTSQDNLTQSIARLNATLKNTANATAALDNMLNAPDGSLKNSIGNIESISTNLKNSNAQISKMIENFATISDTLAKANIGHTIYSLDSSLSQLSAALKHINKGRGTAGNLVYNDSLYVNLEKATKNLEILLKDINENPKKYVNFSLF